MCCARCPAIFPPPTTLLQLPGLPGKCQALADPCSGTCSVTGKCCSVRALCLPGLPQLLPVATCGMGALPGEGLMPWGVGGCMESIGSGLRSTLGCGGALPHTVLPLSLWEEWWQLAVLSLFRLACCSCRASHTNGSHAPTTPITTSPRRCNETVEVCVELSQTLHYKLRILPTIPTPSSLLCGL